MKVLPLGDELLKRIVGGDVTEEPDEDGDTDDPTDDTGDTGDNGGGAATLTTPGTVVTLPAQAKVGFNKVPPLQ